jgi:uncharacterized protein (TIGR03435 family)
VIGALLFLGALAVFAQPSERPKFEVAAIKPAGPTGPRFVRPLPGGRLSAMAPVRLLIQNAYSLFPFQIVGGPDWLSSERYEIDAKVDGNPANDELLLMLQSLLEERFQLKTHRETKELPVYSLVPAKNGPRLPPPKEGNCTASGEHLPSTLGRTIISFPCGRLRIGIGGSDSVIKGGNVVMAELIRILSTMMGRTVVDKTGFTGAFDVEMHFIPDTATAGLPDTDPSAPDPARATIFTALQENLGLKLESTKGAVALLVIDHVERPTGN